MPAIAFVGDSERKEEEEGTDERLKLSIGSNVSTTVITNYLLIAFLHISNQINKPLTIEIHS